MFSTALGTIVQNAIKALYHCDIDISTVKIEKTSADYNGDFTLVVFPLLKISRQNPETTATLIGNYLLENNTAENIEVIKGFLNIRLSAEFIFNILKNHVPDQVFGYVKAENDSELYLLEFSSPNTNKPLHLGHIRNNLLGWSLAAILSASGKKVKKINLINDRGIHICKSMVAYLNHFSDETPENTGIKGDHLAGKYYVAFDKEWREQCANLAENGANEKEVGDLAPVMMQARELLRFWEQRDAQTISVWKKLNSWVLEGFESTYKRLGIDFDKTEFESEIYEEGRNIVLKGVQSGILQQDPDGSVWIDLTNEGFDRKLLLRSDSTTVYMTQDIATAIRRAGADFPDKMVYVVGNEQEYHFKILKLTLLKLGYEKAAETILHYSYGMVELPAGKMKSREGTVVDADDLMDEMHAEAERIGRELGKAGEMEDSEAFELFEMIGLGALKYFILKVDPKKSIMFDPSESIDFTGNTGPFIQYTHARIKSLIRKAAESGKIPEWQKGCKLEEEERKLMLLIYDFPEVLQKAAFAMSPAMIANFAYELASAFNSFYQKYSVMNESDESKQKQRLMLCQSTAHVLKNAMSLLGVSLPEKM